MCTSLILFSDAKMATASINYEHGLKRKCLVSLKKVTLQIGLLFYLKRTKVSMLDTDLPCVIKSTAIFS